MPTDDLKQHINSSQDFYELLGVESSATEAEIRRAYRQTARKYHPDKVGANNTAALEKFHLLQIAYDVLSDVGVKELYDNARRARQERKDREAAFQGRRKAMMDELERRESGAVKRKHDEMAEEERFERELQRIAEDGKRRRKEREQQLREEEKKYEQEAEKRQEQATKDATGNVDDMDRSITIRFPKSEATAHLEQAQLTKLFSRFGQIEDIVLRDKRLKPPGEKHRRDYHTAVIVYKSIVGAHAAIADFPNSKVLDEDLNMIEAVDWASGREPDAIPKVATPDLEMKSGSTPSFPASRESVGTSSSQTGTPRFSFNPGKASGGTPSLDETIMMRLKNAEKRRLEAKLRQEEAVSDGAV